MAITAHGRILHDATVTSINNTSDGGLGTISWHDPHASSLSELVTELGQSMGKDLIDGQIATALLTGIVAETDRFSNDKTSSQTMSVSSVLMAAGANQQLVATKLEEPRPVPKHESYQPDAQSSNAPTSPVDVPHKRDPGMLEIKHDEPVSRPAVHQPATPYTPPPTEPSHGNQDVWSPEPAKMPDVQHNPEPPHEHDFPKIKFEEPQLPAADAWKVPAGDHLSPGAGIMKEPPSMMGTLTANFQPEPLDPSIDPLSQPAPGAGRLLDHSGPVAQQPAAAPPPPPPPPPLTPEPSAAPPPPPVPPQPEAPKHETFIPGMTPPPPAWVPPSDDPFNTSASNDTQTLSEIEKSVDSPHLHFTDVNAARDEVNRALDAAASNSDTEPIEALNAQPLGDPLHQSGDSNPQNDNDAGDSATPPTYQQQYTDHPNAFESPASDVSDAGAPPPVPPPMPFQFGDPGQS